MSFEAIVSQFVRKHQLLSLEGKYLVALSGGADSVALMLLLSRLGYQVEAVHCNFHLRGDESRRDEQFVVSLCADLGVVLHCAHFDTRTYAQVHKVSIEMAARELRYRYFEQLRSDLGLTDICVAHHQDDSVETVLMNLIRGTGIHGLTGISPRQGHVVRPLLCVSRKQIEQWLQQQKQPFITDSTNLVADVWRNKLRLNVIPQLLDITPQASHNILNTAQLLQQTALVSDDSIGRALLRICKENTLSISELLKEPSPQSVLFAWLEPKGFTSATIAQISQHLSEVSSGKEWFSPTHEICVHRGQLLLQQRQVPRRTMRMPESGVYVYDEHIRFRLTISNHVDISKDAHVVSLDAETVNIPFTVRGVMPGDRFCPLGMSGSRLLSDFLTDCKLSLFEKRRQLVITDASDNIVWVVGLRPDHRFRITDHTRRCLVIALETDMITSSSCSLRPPQ